MDVICCTTRFAITIWYCDENAKKYALTSSSQSQVDVTPEDDDTAGHSGVSCRHDAGYHNPNDNDKGAQNDDSYHGPPPPLSSILSLSSSSNCQPRSDKHPSFIFTSNLMGIDVQDDEVKVILFVYNFFIQEIVLQ